MKGGTKGGREGGRELTEELSKRLVSNGYTLPYGLSTPCAHLFCGVNCFLYSVDP